MSDTNVPNAREFGGLSVLSQLAYACRAARRVLPLYAGKVERKQALNDAIDVAEQIVAGTDITLDGALAVFGPARGVVGFENTVGDIPGQKQNPTNVAIANAIEWLMQSTQYAIAARSRLRDDPSAEPDIGLLSQIHWVGAYADSAVKYVLNVPKDDIQKPLQHDFELLLQLGVRPKHGLGPTVDMQTLG